MVAGAAAVGVSSGASGPRADPRPYPPGGPDVGLPAREVAADHGEVEGPQDRRGRLALQQERERRADKALRVGRAGVEPRKVGRIHRHAVLRREGALADADQAEPAGAVAAAADVDAPVGHRDPSCLRLPPAGGLAARAPVRRAGQVPVARRPDERPTAPARPARATVDPGPRRARARARPGSRERRAPPPAGPVVTRATASRLASSRARARSTSRPERLVGQLAHARERVDPLDEQRPRSCRRCRSRPAPAGRGAPRRSASPPARDRAGDAAPRRGRTPSAVASGPRPASGGWSRSARVSSSSTTGRVEADGDRAVDLEHERPRARPAAATARRAGSGATSRASAGASAARARCRSGRGGSSRRASTAATVAPDDPRRPAARDAGPGRGHRAPDAGAAAARRRSGRACRPRASAIPAPLPAAAARAMPR